jgi:hypothetical protein
MGLEILQCDLGYIFHYDCEMGDVANLKKAKPALDRHGFVPKITL